VGYKQLKVLFIKIKNYFRNNLVLLPLFAFQILLIASVGLLFFNQNTLAETISLAAYLLLVLGVILNLINFKGGTRFE
jgi:hypothetical protein